MSYVIRTALAVSLTAAVLAGCGDSASSPSLAGKQLALSVATKPGTKVAANVAAFVSPTETVAIGNDTLVITQAQVVLRRLELERRGASAPCGAGAETEEQGHNEHADDCEVAKAGPIVLDLPLGTGAQRTFTVPVDTGTYEKFEVQIHRAQAGNPQDTAFLQANPTLKDVSIRVVGTFNKQPFEYTSALEVEQEQELVPPVTIGAAGPLSLTLFTDLSSWFVDKAKNAVIDPATALSGKPNEQQVGQNIRASFRAFEDQNENGGDDHNGDK
jgi:hypothetical protein